MKNQFIVTATASFFQTSARDEAVSFSLPIEYSFQSLFIKNPGNVYNYTVYLEPLTNMSWICIIVFLILVPVVVHTVARSTNELPKISLGESFETVYMALFRMSSPFDPSKQSTRVVFGR